MTVPDTPGLSPERPFPGLRPFAFEDHDFYFGRKAQFFALYRLLDVNRFVAVVGSSGSGKSSLVRAGLLPLLKQESDEAGARKWRWVEMRPGDGPIAQLGDALAQLARAVEQDADPIVAAAREERIRQHLQDSSFGVEGALGEIAGLEGTSLLLVVDQFEELFRYVLGAGVRPDQRQDGRTRNEATRFVQLLLAASRSRSYDVRVVITMRSDFIGDCARFQGLPEAVSAAQFLVPSLTRDQREQVIRGPLREAKASIDATLVERILIESTEELDQLPVMAHCLRRLWDRAGMDLKDPAAPRVITAQHYQEIGGIVGALSRHADDVLRDLPGLTLVVEQTFRALSELDSDGRATRRARLFEQLVAETGVAEDDLRKVLDRFRAEDCSFLTPSLAAMPVLDHKARVDVGHEALLRRWEAVSGEPGATGEVNDTRRLGWLMEEARDGRRYQALLALVDNEGTTTLPLDQVERHWSWWTARPRTRAWAARYGGGHARVQQLIDRSREALEADIRHRKAEAAKEQQMLDRERRAYRFTRIAAVVSSALLVVVLLASVWAWRSDYEAERTRDVGINQTRNLAVAVSDALRQGLVSTAAARQILNTAEAALTDLSQAIQTPKVRAARVWLYVAAADVYLTLGNRAEALDRARNAEQLARKLAADEPTEINRQLHVDALSRIGDVELKYKHADTSYDTFMQAQSQLEALTNPQNGSKQLCDRVLLRVRIADAMHLRKQLDSMIELLEKTAPLAAQCANSPDARMARLVLPAVIQIKIGTALGVRPAANEQAALESRKLALERLNKATTDLRDLGTSNGDIIKYNLADGYVAKADILTAIGAFRAGTADDYADRSDDYAHLNYRRAIDLFDKLFDKDPGNVNWLIALASAYRHHGLALQKNNDPKEALERFSQETYFLRKLVAANEDNVDWKQDLEASQKREADLIAQHPTLQRLNTGEGQVSPRR